MCVTTLALELICAEIRPSSDDAASMNHIIWSIVCFTAGWKAPRGPRFHQGFLVSAFHPLTMQPHAVIWAFWVSTSVPFSMKQKWLHSPFLKCGTWRRTNHQLNKLWVQKRKLVQYIKYFRLIVLIKCYELLPALFTFYIMKQFTPCSKPKPSWVLQYSEKEMAFSHS